MKSRSDNMISDWLDKHGDPEIDKKVKQKLKKEINELSVIEDLKVGLCQLTNEPISYDMHNGSTGFFQVIGFSNGTANMVISSRHDGLKGKSGLTVMHVTITKKQRDEIVKLLKILKFK